MYTLIVKSLWYSGQSKEEIPFPRTNRTGTASLWSPGIQNLRAKEVPRRREQRHLLRPDAEMVLGGARGLLERAVCEAPPIHHRQLATSSRRILGVDPNVSGATSINTLSSFFSAFFKQNEPVTVRFYDQRKLSNSMP